MQAEITQKIWGRAQGMVQDAKTGEIVYTSPWTDNLVLNNGLNFCLDNTSTNDLHKKGIFGSWPHGRTTTNSSDIEPFLRTVQELVLTVMQAPYVPHRYQLLKLVI